MRRTFPAPTVAENREVGGNGIGVSAPVARRRKRPWLVSALMLWAMIVGALRFLSADGAEAAVLAPSLVALFGIWHWKKWGLYLYLVLLVIEGVLVLGVLPLEAIVYGQIMDESLASAAVFGLRVVFTFVAVYPLRKQM